jgi:hypothetical protein
MKICPVCNESFGDEFSFCEIDGTKLKRQGGTAVEPGTKKDWSLLGLALVLGAVLITVATIIFAPKARFSASTINSDTVAVAPPQQTAPTTGAVIDTTPSAATDTPSTSATDSADTLLPTSETKKKEKVAKAETDESAPNPKAAATDPDPNSKAAKAAVQPSEQPAPKAAAKTETAANETKEAERPRTVAPAAETKETKKTTAEAKPADKEADGKKKDDKKKKGGFFGVFKKIFGKDN